MVDRLESYPLNLLQNELFILLILFNTRAILEECVFIAYCTHHDNKTNNYKCTLGKWIVLILLLNVIVKHAFDVVRHFHLFFFTTPLIPCVVGPYHLVCSALSACRLHPTRSSPPLSAVHLCSFQIKLSTHLNVGLSQLLLPPSVGIKNRDRNENTKPCIVSMTVK